jgi:hypothetical protein
LEVPIIRAGGALRKLQTGAAGGITGGLGIKVGNMVPACCEQKSGGSIADKFFHKRLSVLSAAVRHPAAGGE